MKATKHFVAVAAFLTAVTAVLPAFPPRSAEETQAMLDFKLSMPVCNQLLSAMGPMTRYVASLPDLKERMARAAKQTLPERVAQVEKDPKAMAILKQNNLSARDYIVGVPTMRQAIWLASGGPGPGLVASPANLAFAKANLAQLKPRMDAADGMPARK
jgi:hypothetical protein